MNTLTHEAVGQLQGIFTWNFSNKFYIETDNGFFIYDFDVNTIIPTLISKKEFLHGYLGKNKGIHLINEFCKPNWTLIQPESI